MFDKTIINETKCVTKENTIIRDGLGKERLIKESAEFHRDLEKHIKENNLKYKIQEYKDE